ncbi:MAG: MBL fold metallo-hydrolase, partial [Chloroflexi bacterium]
KYPQWSPRFDSEPDIAIQTRKQLFERAASEGMPVLAYHFPFPGLGYIREDGETWRWEPL